MYVLPHKEYYGVSKKPEPTGKTINYCTIFQFNKLTHCPKFRGISTQKASEVEEKYFEPII